MLFIKRLTVKRNILSLLKVNEDFKVLCIAAIFILLNALKITVFNYYIFVNQNINTFMYKLGFTLLLCGLIYPLIFKIKSKVLFITIYILQIIYLIVNLLYYLYFHSYLNLMQGMALFTEGFTAAERSAAPKSFKLLASLIDVPAFIYVVYNYYKLVRIQSIRKNAVRIVLIICLITLVFFEVQNYNYKYSLLQFAVNTYESESTIVQRYGTVVNNILNIRKSKGDAGMASSLKYGRPQSNKTTSSPNPNYILIQVESLDSSVINQKYAGEYIAPFLHSLSEKSIYYPYTLSYHMGGGTSDCEFSIINSIEPLDKYPAIKLQNYNPSNSMIRKLSEGSYTSIAFHGNVGNFYNRDVAFPKMGFADFLDMARMNLNNVGWGAPDGDVFNYSLNYLKNAKKPFLGYIITMTSHGPFDNAKHYFNEPRYNLIHDETAKNYFNSITYTDKTIGDFVCQIKSSFNNTYIFIWGDHTPNITTDYYKQASFSVEDKYFEFVPLIIITPDNKVYKETKSAASFLDIAPTILYSSGIKFDQKSDGVNLLGLDLKSTIPYKGKNYDRTFLYSKVEDALK